MKSQTYIDYKSNRKLMLFHFYEIYFLFYFTRFIFDIFMRELRSISSNLIIFRERKQSVKQILKAGNSNKIIINELYWNLITIFLCLLVFFSLYIVFIFPLYFIIDRGTRDFLESLRYTSSADTHLSWKIPGI